MTANADAAARFLAALPAALATATAPTAATAPIAASVATPRAVDTPITAPASLPLALSVAEVAALLRVDRKTIYGAIAVGDLPARRIGAGRKRFVVGRDALLAWLAGAA